MRKCFYEKGRCDQPEPSPSTALSAFDSERIAWRASSGRDAYYASPALSAVNFWVPLVFILIHIVSHLKQYSWLSFGKSNEPESKETESETIDHFNPNSTSSQKESIRTKRKELFPIRPELQRKNYSQTDPNCESVKIMLLDPIAL